MYLYLYLYIYIYIYIYNCVALSELHSSLQVRALKSDISRLRNSESAAATVRSKERSLKELEPGGEKHFARPFTARAKFAFRFPPAPRCSKEVIELEGVAHGYDGRTLFKDIDLCIERGDRIAIIGISICLHTHIYRCVCIYIYIYMNIYMYIFISMYLHVKICIVLTICSLLCRMSLSAFIADMLSGTKSMS